MIWALTDAQQVVAGAHLTVFTDSESVYHKVTSFSKSDSTQDVRVQRRLGWIMSKFDSTKLTVKYLPGKMNTLADVLSR